MAAEGDALLFRTRRQSNWMTLEMKLLWSYLKVADIYNTICCVAFCSSPSPISIVSGAESISKLQPEDWTRLEWSGTLALADQHPVVCVWQSCLGRLLFTALGKSRGRRLNPAAWSVGERRTVVSGSLRLIH